MKSESDARAALGLPDVPYYSKAEYQKIRDAYVAYAAKLLELSGVPAAEAAAFEPYPLLEDDTVIEKGEVKVIMVNFGTDPFEIRRGDRIAQLVVARTDPHLGAAEAIRAVGLSLGAAADIGER